MNLVLKFQSCNWVMMRCQSRLTRKLMEGEEILELELNSNELVDVALKTNYAQDFDLDVDLDLVNVGDVDPPTIKLIDAQCHASLLSSFL